MENKTLTAIGLMSGTSMDGIDAAIIKTDGITIKEIGDYYELSYSNQLKDRIREALLGNADSALEMDITHLHAKAVNELLNKAGLNKNDVDVIGFHGQTIKHDPENGITLQIGDGKLLASLTGIDVVNNFRINDVKNGGQGAPLVPLYHQAIVKVVEHPVAIVNIGGVANVTYINGDEVIAFDTGPGNALIDDWMLKNNAGYFDEGGKYAEQGDIDETSLAMLINNPYFNKKPPKSLDRNEFDTKHINGLSIEDGSATLAAFTIASIVMADHHFPLDVKSWYICGGGRHNSYIFEGMKKMVMAPVLKIEDLGYNGDMIEAQAFGFLAVRSLYKLYLTMPSTTGVKEPHCGGVLNKA